MICRLLIITIVIANSSNEFKASYILITVCGTVVLIHLLVKPYTYQGNFNKVDGIILQIITFVAVLPLLDGSTFIITIAFVLIILTLLIFIVIVLFLHKESLKKVFTYFTFSNESPSNKNVNNCNEMPVKEFHNIVDDSTRTNVTICDE